MKLELFKNRRGNLNQFARFTAVLLVIVLFVTMPGSLAEADSLASPNAPDGRTAVATASQAHVLPNVRKPVPPTGDLIYSSAPSDGEFFRNCPFQEPLVPIGGATSTAENQALAAALKIFVQRKTQDDFSSIDAFLNSYPQSGWRISLLTDMGLIYRKTGWYSKSLSVWEEAWALGKTQTSPAAVAVVDRALAELISLNASLGRVERLDPLLAEIKGRSIIGSAEQKIEAAEQGLAWMKAHPKDGYRCGPLAVEAMRAHSKTKIPFNLQIKTEPSTPKGTSLTQIYHLSQKIGLDLQMAKRAVGSTIVTPSVIHWKAGHFAAAIGKNHGLIELHDPTFGDNVWVTPQALDAESDGFVLIAKGNLPSGWTSVSATEGDKVWGKGPPNVSQSNANAGPTPKTPKNNPCGGSNANQQSGTNSAPGSPQQSSTTPTNKPAPPKPTSPDMATYSIFEMAASLCVEDTPVFYNPAYGPPVEFTISYSQREANQPSTFNYSNLGPLWTFSFLSYITDNPQNQQANVSQYLSGGGTLIYTYDSSISGFDPQSQNLSQLQVLTSSSYQLTLPDGSVQIFSTPGAGTTSRNIYLTKSIDPSGNALTFNYDSTYRMTSVTDALGNTTSIAYGSNNVNTLPAYYQIAKVTEHYGRSAAFTYDADGNLSSSTDMLGMTSSYFYTNGVMSSMKTPYGTTTFNTGQNGLTRWVDVTDPMGGRERLETWDDANPLQQLNVPPPQPANANTTYLMYRNTFYWTKKQWMESPGNYNNANIIHWLHEPNITTMSDVVESYKAPLENRVCYLYPGQSQGSYVMGTSTQPSQTEELLPDNVTTRTTNTTYNAQGNLLQSEDPFGRFTTYVYAVNGVDLTDVYQGSSTSGDHVAHYTYYPNTHLVNMATDAAGQSTTYTYNMATGQPITVTNAKNEKWTLGYNSAGFLTSITGPTVNSSTPNFSFTPDSYGRVGSFTDVNGYVRQFGYDLLDRPTTTTYPDGTFESNIYNKLDVSQSKDRQNRWTSYFFNANDQMVAVLDADNRLMKYNRCICGALTGIVDPNGNLTSWNQDVEGRNTSKTMADGTQYTYSYDSLGRLISVTDPKFQVTTYSYTIDDCLSQSSYSNAAIATPTVSCVWDSIYPRIDSMSDGTGTTNYQYYPVNVLGAGQLKTETGPLPNSAINSTYDPLGRPLNAMISDGFNSSVSYDPIGRVNSAVNQLGTFTYNYYAASFRLQRITNDQSALNINFAYSTGTGEDFRLSDVSNNSTGTTVLSKFDYSYSPQGDIITWEKQADSNSPTLTTYHYDQADQLVGATTTTTTPTPAVVSQYLYRYDPIGNRTTEQIGLNVVSSTYNKLNQSTGVSPGGPLEVAGSLNKPGTVTVNGNTAVVDGASNFSAVANATTGTNTLTVVATNLNGNALTNKFQVVVPSASPSAPAYDANGNLINNGSGQIYAWDAKNELTQITYANGSTTSFVYDGRGRRSSIVENNSGGTVTKQEIWIGDDMAEERNGTNAVQKRFYSQGEQVGAANYYYTRDHLGSVREMTDRTGAVQARYDYDPFGKVIPVGTIIVASDFQYAGYYEHAPSALNLTKYRAYDPNVATWLSRDPIAEQGGINLYNYAQNDPIDGIDPLGLRTCWKHVLMTTFGDGKGDKVGYMGDKLKSGDIAVGNGAANADNRYPSKAKSNGPGGLKIPYNTPVFVDPNHSSPFHATVKDYGAYDIDHPGTGKGDWVDRWDPNASRHNQSDHGWISLDVDDCKSCPAGWSEAPRAQPAH